MLRFSPFMTVFILLSLFAVNIHAEEGAMQGNAINSFEPIVERITRFFSKHPKLLTKIASPDNPKLEAYSITHFQMEKVSYDIFVSNSILYPFRAHIDVDTQVADNKPCGNRGFTKSEKEGWINVEDAIKNANTSSCFVIRTPQTGIIRHRFIFQFNGKTGMWSLTEIVYQDGTINGRFMAILGIPSPWFPVIREPQAISYNRDWIELFKGL